MKNSIHILAMFFFIMLLSCRAQKGAHDITLQCEILDVIFENETFIDHFHLEKDSKKNDTLILVDKAGFFNDECLLEHLVQRPNVKILDYYPYNTKWADTKSYKKISSIEVQLISFYITEKDGKVECKIWQLNDNASMNLNVLSNKGKLKVSIIDYGVY